MNEFMSFDSMYEQLLIEREKFNKEVSSKWGDDKVVDSEKKIWVEYNDDKDSRSIVDFESGDIKIEILLSEEEFKNGIGDEKLTAAIERMLSSDGRNSSYDSATKKDNELHTTPILDRQIDLNSYGIDLKSALAPVDLQKRAAPPMPNVGSQNQLASRDKNGASNTTSSQTLANKLNDTPEELDSAIADTPPSLSSEEDITEAAKAIVQKTESKISEIIDNTGEKKLLISLDLKLAENHVSVRASKYSSIISSQAKRFSVAEPVVYAIMEQESSFLETAKSPAPAYGLMQLVPKSGGLEAYRYVYKEDKIVSESYLYNPQNNVELGVALIRVLLTRDFVKVTDERCRLLCAIAAYNCGAGNVSRAIINSTNLPKAIPEINKMSYDELFALLQKRLLVVIGHDETSVYIEKVTNNIKKYSNQAL